MAQRIDALQADLSRMRGEVEMLQNQSEGGKTQTRNAVRRSRKTPRGARDPGRSRWCRCRRRGWQRGAAARGQRRRAGQPTTRRSRRSRAATISARSAGFKSFVATYPDSPLASNAQYWLGEAYYVNREYPNAITAFQAVTTQ